MKANAIKTLGAFAVILLFMSGTLYAQYQGPPSPVFTLQGYNPVDFELPTDPSLGAAIQQGGTYGLYQSLKKTQMGDAPVTSMAKGKNGKMIPTPPPGSEELVNPTPNYFNVDITYYTLPNGDEIYLKGIVANGIDDKLPVPNADGTPTPGLEKAMEAWEALNEANNL